MPLLNVANLFAYIFQAVFHSDNLKIHLHHLAFASNGVDLPMHLLTEKIQAFAKRLVMLEEDEEIIQMDGQPLDLLID